MQYNYLAVARHSTVVQKVKNVSVRLSVAAVVLGSSVVSIAGPSILHAQSPVISEALPNEILGSDEDLRFEPKVYLEHIAGIEVKQAKSVNPGSVYAPATPIASVDLMRGAYAVSKAPAASVDLMGGIYANSQTPVEQQAYQQAQATNGVMASQVPTSDRLRGVYGDMAVQVAPQSLTSSELMRLIYQNGYGDEEVYMALLAISSGTPAVAHVDPIDQLRYVYENGHVAVEVLNNVLLAQGRPPVVARGPVPQNLARAVYGDEYFLYSAPVTSAVIGSESDSEQAFFTPHRPGDAI